ncbi:MAG: tetratricopeptide repeat protein, partial [Verrucomicrobiia bacterium]
MRRNNSVATCLGVLALTSWLFVTQGAIAAMETNTVQLTNEQTVILLERTGRYDEAEARCMQMLQQNPSDPDARRLLAEIEDAKHKPHASPTLREALDEIII